MITACNWNGATPLHVASSRQKPDMIEALLSAGAEVDPRNEVCSMHAGLEDSPCFSLLPGIGTVVVPTMSHSQCH
jgi:ankyrin repeat protein